MRYKGREQSTNVEDRSGSSKIKKSSLRNMFITNWDTLQDDVKNNRYSNDETERYFLKTPATKGSLPQDQLTQKIILINGPDKLQAEARGREYKNVQMPRRRPSQEQIEAPRPKPKPRRYKSNKPVVKLK